MATLNKLKRNRDDIPSKIHDHAIQLIGQDYITEVEEETIK